MIAPVESLDPFVDQVYQRLRRAIAFGEIPPGQRVPQAEIAASFGVSRQPVSHALRLLRQQGLIEAWGRKGFAVAAVQAGKLRELYEIRGALDALAARLAAERVRSGEVPPERLGRARAILAESSEVDAETPRARLLELELAFHREIYALSGNGAIEGTLDALWPHLLRAMALIHSHRTLTAESRGEHDAILSSIAAGDAALAEERALAHTRRASREIAALLPQHDASAPVSDVA